MKKQLKNKAAVFAGGLLGMALICASLISCTPKNNAKKDSASKYRNVIYTYTLGDVTYPEMYTHVIISFFKADNVGNLFEKSFPHTPETVKTFKKEHPKVKVLGAIGGGSYSEFLTPVMLDEEYRTRLAKQLCDFVASHHLDGIDLDWEYYEDYPESNAAYLDFAQQLRKKLPKNAVLSMAGQKAPQFYRDESIVTMMKDVLDFTNVMTYDFDYDNKMNRTVGYNGSFTETKLTMNDYAKALGGDKSKLNTGKVSIFVITAILLTWNISGYFSGLSSPSGTESNIILILLPVSNSAGHTKLPIFSKITRSRPSTSKAFNESSTI